MNDDEPDDLSEETLFWGAKQIDADTKDGTRPSSASTALQKWGQPEENWWPYDQGRDHRASDYLPPPDAIDPDHCSFSSLRSLTVELTEIKRELDAGRPVVLGIPVWDGLRRASSEPLPAPAVADLYPTKHAIVIAGYDTGRGAILIRNSWGARWGTDGYLWASDGLLAHAFGAWVIDDSTARSIASQP